MNTNQFDNPNYSPEGAMETVRQLLAKLPTVERPSFGLQEFQDLAMPLVDWLMANQPNLITFQVTLDLIDAVCYRLGFIYTSDSCSPHEAAIQNLRLVRKTGLTADDFELDEKVSEPGFAKYCYEFVINLTNWFMAQNWSGPQIAASLEAVKVGLELLARPAMAARLELDRDNTGFSLGYNPAL